jgi:hypothetical protein
LQIVFDWWITYEATFETETNYIRRFLMSPFLHPGDRCDEAGYSASCWCSGATVSWWAVWSGMVHGEWRAHAGQEKGKLLYPPALPPPKARQHGFLHTQKRVLNQMM